MAEPARADMAGDLVRVRLRITNSERARELANMLRARRCLVAESSDFDVTLSDGNANSLELIAEGESNARGVLPADASADQVDAALRAVVAGLSVHGPQDARFSALDEDEAPSPLTPRELEILIALSEGLGNRRSHAVSTFRSTR